MDSGLRSLLGTEIGGFRLTAFIGEGGMAAVFRGENTLNASIVRAIKVVHPELSARQEFCTRFIEEATILEQLSHPNVVKFHGLRRERHNGIDLLVLELELLQGASLASNLERVNRQPTRVHDAVEMFAQASDGVAAAHALGVVHRDIKPENLFVTTNGVVKVLDFGIARAVDDADRAAKATMAGTVPGSPPYMAPEVCEGAVPSTSADVYALGMSLYETLLGHHPFLPPGTDRKSTTQLMFAQVHTVLPDIRTARPDVSAAVAAVVARATAKQPNERYPSARELSVALRGMLAAMPAEATGPHESHSRTAFATPTFQLASNSTTAPLAIEAAVHEKPANKVAMGIAVVGAIAVVAAGAVAQRAFSHGRHRNVAVSSISESAASTVSPATSVTLVAAAPATPVAPEANRWIRVDPPPAGTVVRLGHDTDHVADSLAGFRPTRNIRAPGMPYEIQAHEVTWREIDPWLAREAAQTFARPVWVPIDVVQRADLPVTGVPWQVAHAYCRSIGAALPTEEQWEYAARGSERRPNPWGTGATDTELTHAYQGTTGRPVAVMSSDQDQTPGGPQHAIFDMAGNAQEWTSDLYRDDRPGQNEAWVETGGRSFRAIRGLPLAAAPPSPMPAAAAVYREAMCATGNCPAATARQLEYIGFRCAKWGA